MRDQVFRDLMAAVCAPVTVVTTAGEAGPHGVPRLDRAAAFAACELKQAADGGDHLLLIGLVTHAESRQAAPLVYGHRTFGTHSRFAHRPRRPIHDMIAACAR